MDRRKDRRSSPRKYKKSSRLQQRHDPELGPPVKTERRIIYQHRNHKTGCCHNAERCKGIGAVLFTLGIPATIAGVILTVVAHTDDESEDKYPASFKIAGPLLLVCAVILFLTGLSLYHSNVCEIIQNCFSLDEPNSLCRLHCKTLSQCLKRDDAIAINQAAMKALQSVPGKPVLKRGRSQLSSVASDGDVKPEESNDSNTVGENDGPQRRVPKGVHFFEYDSDQPGNTTESGSALSLRHCKIYPKNGPENIWWTDKKPAQKDDPVHKEDVVTEL